MKLNKSRTARRRPVSSLPMELMARLRCVSRQTKYKDQVDALSMVFPHGEYLNYRWFLHHSEMPYLHVMETYDSGNLMILHVLLPTLRSVLTLKKKLLDWEIQTLTREDEIETIVPDRFEDGDGGWTLKPASKAQLRTIANQISVPIHRIPNLTAFNAQLVIQTTLIMRHLPHVNEMIENVVQNSRLYSGLQHVRSNILESV